MRSKTSTPRVHFNANNALAQQLTQSCPAFREPVRFSWFTSFWLVQTLLYMFTRTSGVTFRRQILPVGGDQIALDWDNSSDELPSTAPIALLFPTILGGSSELGVMAKALRTNGFRCVVMIRRGHDGLALHTPCWNMMGNVADVEAAMAHIHAQYPGAPVSFVAVSAGTGLASLYLSKHGASARVQGAVLQCPAYDLMRVFTRIHWLLDLVFLVDIKRQILWRHRRVLNQAPRYWHALLSCWRMQSLLENLWGVAGCASYEEFERTSNPIHTIGDIRRPTLCINTHDDPACAWSLVPTEIYYDHPSGILLELELGSHLAGFPAMGSPSWFLQATVEFLNITR